MHPNAERLLGFYQAFNRRDADAMGACYARDVQFEDPAFGVLIGDEARAMWRMLCERASDLQVTATDIEADDDHGQARWEATYTFSQTGRRVHNVIEAEFAFNDGLISAHHDHFDFWRWSRQALGPPGWLLGWSSFLREKVKTQARAGLKRYMDSAGAG
jgi:ketosteroid isomerase-like protein